MRMWNRKEGGARFPPLLDACRPGWPGQAPGQYAGRPGQRPLRGGAGCLVSPSFLGRISFLLSLCFPCNGATCRQACSQRNHAIVVYLLAPSITSVCSAHVNASMHIAQALFTMAKDVVAAHHGPSINQSRAKLRCPIAVESCTLRSIKHELAYWHQLPCHAISTFKLSSGPGDHALMKEHLQHSRCIC